MQQPFVRFDHVEKSYDGKQLVVRDLTLDIAQGEFLTLLGPSGSGKTSTLRLVGGFDQLNGGAILINGERIDHLPAYQRDTATIFQSGALFPHKTVAENVAFGLRMRKIAAAEITDRVKQYLDIVRLSGFSDRYPAQLSGGQKQRVALARSLAVRPAILLFDEPLSALDLSLRLQLRAEIKKLHDQLQFSAIYVTHDQGEAMAMSSRVAVMRNGAIEQIDTPEKIFHHPANEFVYTFIGESCCLAVSLGPHPTDSAGEKIDLVLEGIHAPGNARLYIRPSRLRFGADAASLPNRLKARVEFVEFLGDLNRYHLRAGGLEMFADDAGVARHRAGDNVDVGWLTHDMQVFR